MTLEWRNIIFGGFVQFFATPWTVSCQTPLSIEFPVAKTLEWFAISFSRDLPDPGIEPVKEYWQPT